METQTGLWLDSSFNGTLRHLERFAGPIPAYYRPAATEALYQDLMRRFEKFSKQEKIERPVPQSEKLQEDGSKLTSLTREMTGILCVRGLQLELGKELWEEVLVPNKYNQDGDEDFLDTVQLDDALGENWGLPLQTCGTWWSFRN
ncbi:hypothetical protein HD806DRAFT_540063 [Xylariaceae sp. AK1471]|nr:hypothetical protein HD806DRAFT_540063 [Xylariaceae sp. AK1471]